MTAIVEISAVETTVQCDEKGNAEHKVTVHNISGRELRVGARILVDPPAKNEWVGPIIRSDQKDKKETEWDLAENDTIQLTVPIRAKDAAQGNYGFRVEVFSTDAPGEEYVTGNTLAFKVPAKKVEPVKEEKKKFPMWIIFVILGVLLVIGGGVTAWVLMGGTTKVPDLVNMTFNDAEAALDDKDLKVGDVTEQLTGTQPIGTVIKQDPEKDSEVEKSTKVALVVEAVSVAVPNLVGKVPAEAQEMLATENLVLDQNIVQSRTGRAKGGTIIDQDPKADQRVRPETAVKITVEEENIQVPSVIGQTQVEAGNLLSSQGLRVGKISERKTGGTPGVVLSQNPAANSQVAPGTAVALVVEEHKISLPNLTGMTVSTAGSKLKSLGLTIGNVTNKVTGKKPGTIISQSPRAGSQVSPGSSVALTAEFQPIIVKPFLPIKQIPLKNLQLLREVTPKKQAE